MRSKLKVWLEFGGLAFIIMLPLLLPGYILTLDLVFTPHISMPNFLSHDFLLEGVLWLAYHILPGDVVEKIVLFGSLLISGVGAYELIQILPRSHVRTDNWRLMSYVAGIFYMINQFIYARIIAGQWMIVLGYAFLPFFMIACIKFLRSPSLKTGLIMAAWLTAISVVSLHYVGVAIVLAALCIGAFSTRSLRAMYGKWGLLTCGVLIAVNLYWLLPLIVSGNEVTQSVSHFDASHFTAFETVGGVVSVLQLQGFWVEVRQLFILPQKIMPLWGLFVILLWAILIYGGVSAWRNRSRRIVVVSCSSIALGMILAVSPLVEWASGWAPFIAGYREPHKFVALIAVGYSILLAYGGAYILEKVKQPSTRWRDTVMTAFFLLPILITPTMFGGFAGQLTPRVYPQEWYEFNRLLKQDTPVERVLFLPWHQYANYSFSGRIIANPAEKFFEVPIVASDDPEYKNISPTAPNEEKKQLTRAITAKQLPLHLLKKVRITHIIVAKEQDWNKYRTLLESDSFEHIYENNKLILYKVRAG